MFNVLIETGNKEHKCAWWIYILIELCRFTSASWKVKRRNMGLWSSGCDTVWFVGWVTTFQRNCFLLQRTWGQQVPLKCWYTPTALHSVTTRLQHYTLTYHVAMSHQLSPMTAWILITCIVAWSLTECPDTDRHTQSGAVSKSPECPDTDRCTQSGAVSKPPECPDTDRRI